LIAHYLVAFVLTQIVEVPIYLRALGGRDAKKIAIAFGASAWTHPIATIAIPALWAVWLPPVEYVHGETALTLGFVTRAAALAAICEGFAVIGEAAYLAAFRVRRPLAWSFAANGASFTIGVLLTMTTGWP
jgi:hypothetical protein